MAEEHLIRLNVNGTTRDVVVEPRRPLGDVLREEFGLTGTHITCEQGICGVCTVLVDGEPVRSCLILAVQADDRRVETVESLAEAGQLSDLQQEFIAQHGVQCGFCTPGFLMLSTWFLRTRENPTDDEIQEMVASNLCRCTGCREIVRAVQNVRDARNAESEK
ncbi:(2Fe-2S)-binding protein [Micromonospora sp. NPDC048830]|uniref:(2Fe-2S)-binding protein n=1 Tax=Micromonospora sp. NPDC048830 TaxID=3364257 RepID=UPI003713B2C1